MSINNTFYIASDWADGSAAIQSDATLENHC